MQNRAVEEKLSFLRLLFQVRAETKRSIRKTFIRVLLTLFSINYVAANKIDTMYS